MKLPKELITITPVSKALAIFLFVTLPFVGFLFGIRYQQILDEANELETIPLLIHSRSAQTVNLQTQKNYANTKYNYSFQYPATLTPSSPIGDDAHISSAESISLSSTDGPDYQGYPPFYVLVVSPTGAIKVEYNDDWFVQNINPYLSTPIGTTIHPSNSLIQDTFTRNPDITIDGMPAAVFENPHEKRVVVKKNNLLYVIGGYGIQTSDFAQIIPTFRFQ
jgi:hypothetical protein